MSSLLQGVFFKLNFEGPIHPIRDSQSVQTNPIHYTDSNTLYSGHDFQFSKRRKNALFLLNFNETLRQNLGVPGYVQLMFFFVKCKGN